MAAAVALYRQGIRDLLILEREHTLGGILRQCIHDGFGLARFGQTLSGPEYAKRFADQVEEYQIPYETDTTVIGITPEKKIYAVSRKGLLEIQAEAVVLAMGCRERTRGAISIPGDRPAGVYTAGVAQAYVNLYNKMPGKEVVILGSGDIGMIMARRMTLEGAHVQAVFEVQPFASGLPRNIVQCLEDYGIPLYLSHTVTQIKGRDRLEAVVVSEVDEKKRPIPGTEREYACDTLILSVGLIPENELSLSAGVELDARTRGAVVDLYHQTSIPGIFAAGNVLQVHDLVDFVSMEAEELAGSAAAYIRTHTLPACRQKVVAGPGVAYTVPQKVCHAGACKLSLRVNRPMEQIRIELSQNGQVICKKRMAKAIPAEMIQVPVPGAALSENGDLEVRICQES